MVKLDAHFRAFMAAVAVRRARDLPTRTACMDASAHGDAPGFVAGAWTTIRCCCPTVLGNRRVDSFSKYSRKPSHRPDLLRARDRRAYAASEWQARITTDPTPLAARGGAGESADDGDCLSPSRKPASHCAKALIRSRLWDPAARGAVGVPHLRPAYNADQIAGVRGGSRRCRGSTRVIATSCIDRGEASTWTAINWPGHNRTAISWRCDSYIILNLTAWKTAVPLLRGPDRHRLPVRHS